MNSTENERGKGVKMGCLGGRVAIVTGAGRGIGKATAMRFASEGARVIVVDLDATCAERVVQEIRAAGAEASALTADVSLTKDANRLVAESMRWAGGIDILINNAGIFPRARVIDITEEEWDRVLAVNLKSAFLCSRAVLPHMIKNNYGRIVNVTSRMALQGAVAGAHYAAAKAGIIGLTASLAAEVADYGINVNAISPGVTATRMVLGANSPERIKEFASKLPYKRLWKPDEVVGSILYLVSEDSNYVTGQILYMWA